MLNAKTNSTWTTRKRIQLQRITRSGSLYLTALFLIAGIGSASTALNGRQLDSSANVHQQKVTPARFLVKVMVPVKAMGMRDTNPPKHVVDFLFPDWHLVAPPGRTDSLPGPLIIALEVRSPQPGLLGSLWGFRKDPHQLMTLGMAEPNPTGTETNLQIKGQAELVRIDTQYYLQATYEFPNPQVAGEWLTKFPANSKIFEAGFRLSPDLIPSEVERMKNFWRNLFEAAGKLRIEVSGEKNFVLEYDLKKADGIVFENEWVRVPYTAASPSKIVSGKL